MQYAILNLYIPGANAIKASCKMTAVSPHILYSPPGNSGIAMSLSGYVLRKGLADKDCILLLTQPRPRHYILNKKTEWKCMSIVYYHCGTRVVRPNSQEEKSWGPLISYPWKIKKQVKMDVSYRQKIWISFLLPLQIFFPRLVAVCRIPLTCLLCNFNIKSNFHSP